MPLLPARIPPTSPPGHSMRTSSTTFGNVSERYRCAMELMVHDDAEAAAEGAAGRIAALISDGNGRLSIGLAGGSAAEAAYRALRGRASGWDRVDAWLSDERWVPPDSERSNGRLVATTLLDHVGARFTRPRWSEYLEPDDVAAHYEAHLRSLHGSSPPDLIVLGMGSDGHTASLFPDTRALEEHRRWFVANDVPSLDEMRLTTTFPLLWSARHYHRGRLWSGESRGPRVGIRWQEPCRETR